LPYNDEGFTPRSAKQILEDYEESAKDILDVVNFSSSSLIWQQMKIHSLDEFYYETLLETASEQMSIKNAVGAWLDKHGIENGMPRKGATNAQGYVDASTTISGAPVLIGEGAEFRSSLNAYLADEDNWIPYRIQQTKTKTGESYDYFSSDYPYAENVVQLLKENLSVIPTSVWEFDENFNNNIHFLDASSGYIIENEGYYVEVSGKVTRRVEVTSVASGVVSNAKVGQIITSVTYPFLTVNNSEDILTGADKEADDNYRERQLDAKRRNFTLGKVKDLATNIEGVRAVHVYQDKGVDQTSILNWDSPILGTTKRVDKYKPQWSQSFVPGDLVLSLGRITISGRAINSPPAIKCGIRLNSVATGLHLDYKIIEEVDLIPGLTGFQDINFDVKYNGLDKTKTYRFDIWCHPAEDGITGIDFTTNYWEIRASAEGYGNGETRKLLYKYVSGVAYDQPTGVDLMFKSLYNGAAYTTILSPDDGFGFENLKNTLDGQLDYVDGGGFSPIGIQYQILESEEVDIDIKGIIYVTELADFATVREDVVANIEGYLESLDTGDNVIYSQIEYHVMRHPNVWRQKELYIKRSDQASWTQEDIYLGDNEIPDLGTRNLQLGVG
jgi:uncharacterized phage protein gp47/JayE